MAAKMILIGSDEQLLVQWRHELSARGWVVFSAHDSPSAIDLAIQLQPQVFVADASDFNGHPAGDCSHQALRGVHPAEHRRRRIIDTAIMKLFDGSRTWDPTRRLLRLRSA